MRAGGTTPVKGPHNPHFKHSSPFQDPSPAARPHLAPPADGKMKLLLILSLLALAADARKLQATATATATAISTGGPATANAIAKSAGERGLQRWPALLASATCPFHVPGPAPASEPAPRLAPSNPDAPPRRPPARRQRHDPGDGQRRGRRGGGTDLPRPCAGCCRHPGG